MISAEKALKRMRKADKIEVKKFLRNINKLINDTSKDGGAYIYINLPYGLTSEDRDKIEKTLQKLGYTIEHDLSNRYKMKIHWVKKELKICRKENKDGKENQYD